MTEDTEENKFVRSSWTKTKLSKKINKCKVSNNMYFNLSDYVLMMISRNKVVKEDTHLFTPKLLPSYWKKREHCGCGDINEWGPDVWNLHNEDEYQTFFLT